MKKNHFAILILLLFFSLIISCSNSLVTTYTVTYNANSATTGTVPSDQVKLTGIGLILATNSNSLAKTGYDLAGWNTDADGGGTDYTEGAVYSIDADVTLYAKWTDITITYNSNGAAAVSISSETSTTVSSKSTDFDNCGYTLTNWNSAANGSGTTYTTGDTVSGSITLYAQWSWKTYSINDAGPANGTIYYINGDAATDGWKYLEMSAELHSAYVWITGGSSATTLNGSTSWLMGTGQANTTAIINQAGHTGSAAQLCNAHSVTNNGVTFDDWYLASQNEMQQMRNNLSFTSGWYWSSSEADASNAAILFEGNSSTSNVAKTDTRIVRGSRTF